jgi:hypothetical protein
MISGSSGRSRSNGPPGAMRIMKNAIVTMMKSVGTAPANRLSTYANIG